MIEELQRLIYPMPPKNFDKVNIERTLFKLMRLSLLEHNYEVKVGPYVLNFNPEDLKASYETDLTKVELSLKDIYYESMRPLETKYYCLSNETSDSYSPDTPYYILDGNVVNINGTTEEHYSFEFVSNNPNLNLMDNLNIPADFQIVNNEEGILTIAHAIKPEDERTNPLIFFNKNIKSVYYDEAQDLFINKDTYIKETYQKYLPPLTKEKEVITFIFNTMKEFYQKYQ